LRVEQQATDMLLSQLLQNLACNRLPVWLRHVTLSPP